MKRAIYMILGLAFTAVGIVGVFVPLMPTTVFLILAAACFAKSSPKLEAAILNNPHFGPMVRDWRENGAIPRKAKIIACLSMVGGFVIFLLFMHPATWLALAVAAVMGACAIFVVSRPDGAPRSG